MIFHLFGIPVYISTAFWLTALLFGLMQPSGILLLATVVVVFVAVLTHELGHALVARAFGAQPSIMLHGFGGTTSFPGARLTRPRSILITLAGPGAGFLLGALCLMVTKLIPLQGQFGPAIVHLLLFTTFGWGVLNLLPVLPFDGGLILRDLFGPRFGRVTLVLSSLFGAALCAWCITHRHIYLAVLFGISTLQSVRAFWLYKELRSAEQSRSELARQKAQNAQHLAESGDVRNAEAQAQIALSIASEKSVRDDARRALTVVALHNENSALALQWLADLESPGESDNVLRAQALDLAGKREEAFALLEARSRENPAGPALEALLRGLLATGHQGRALDLASLYAQTGSVQALEWLYKAILEKDASLAELAPLAEGLFRRTSQADFAYQAARAYARKGSFSQALSLLEAAVASGLPNLAHAMAIADFAPLHEYPRFCELLERVNANG